MFPPVSIGESLGALTSRSVFDIECAGVALMVAVPLVPVDAAFHADLPELYRVFNHLTVLRLDSI